MTDCKSIEEAKQSDSDEEVPEIQLCCLSFPQLRALDLSTTEDYSALLSVLAYEESEKALSAVTRIRRFLSVEKNPPIQAMIEAGGVFVLHKVMTAEDERIRYEAAWAFTNLLCGTSKQTSTVLKSGCIATLVELVNSDKSWNIKGQAIWALGNIAGDSPIFRDKVLEAGGMTAILTHLKEDFLAYMRNASWALSNCVRGKPLPHASYILQLVPYILSHLSAETDSEIRIDLLWALSYITEQNSDSVEIDQCTCDKLVLLLNQETVSFIQPALRVIGNLISLSDAYTALFAGSGLLDKIPPLLGHSKKNIRKEACSVLRNLCAESTDIVTAVVLSGILPQVISLALAKKDYEIKREALWVLVSFCGKVTLDLKQSIMEMGITQPLIEALSEEDSQIVNLALDGLMSLLKEIEAIATADKVAAWVSVEEVVSKSKQLAESGVVKAKELLKALGWLIPENPFE